MADAPGPGAARAFDPPLAPKLVPPRLPGRVVSRPRLLALLDRGVAGPVTVVTGGAGAGKTVVVASWLGSGQLPGPAAWVSLDAIDNDPERFWSQLLDALRATGSVGPDNPLAELTPLHRPAEAFYLRVASGVCRLHEPVVLVLDDLHEITEASVWHGLAMLLRQPAPMLRMVLLTRSDPQLPLSRLRLNGQLQEIRGRDLAFTRDEAEALFADSGLALAGTEIDRLLERTEGWAAGLRLAALSLQGRAPTRAGDGAVSARVEGFVGDEQTVTDYLMEEVLSGLPDADRDFLLHTSVVDQVCADLAQALTGRADGQSLLEALERSNAFVVGIGTDRVWFRYHQLFREMLRHELRLRAPELVPTIHRTAAVWWRDHGDPITALRHAIAAPDWTFVDTLAIQSLLPHILGPRRETLCALVDRLPEDQIQTHAGLSLLVAVRDFHLRDVPGMAGRAATAARLADDLPDAEQASILVVVRIIEVIAARLRGDAPALVEATTAAAKVLAGIPPGMVPTHAYQGVIFGNLGTALLWIGELGAAERELGAGLHMATAARLDLPRMNALSHLALIAVGRGQLRNAYARGRVVADIAERRGWTGESQAVLGYLALAVCHHEWGNPAEAAGYLDQAAEAHRLDRERPVAVALHVARARFHLATGAAARARAEIAAAKTCYADAPLPTFLQRLLAVEEADLELATGHPQRVLERFNGLVLADVDPGSSDRERVRLAHAQLATGRARQALTTLDPLLSEQPDNPGPAVEAWLAAALAADHLREDARAIDALSAALRPAAPEARRRPFVTAKPRLHALLARHAELVGPEHDFVAEILTDLARRQAPPAPPPPLAEPLTDRETAVLRYLPTLLGNAEVAEKLYISVNTVKAHLKSLYRKLGVSSRRQAVHRARELGLL